MMMRAIAHTHTRMSSSELVYVSHQPSKLDRGEEIEPASRKDPPRSSLDCPTLLRDVRFGTFDLTPSPSACLGASPEFLIDANLTHPLWAGKQQSRIKKERPTDLYMFLAATQKIQCVYSFHHKNIAPSNGKTAAEQR